MPGFEWCKGGVKLAIDRKREIIDVAAELFREKGYDRTRLQDIAEKVGLLKGSLYYYIKNKEELLWMVVEPSTRIGLDQLRDITRSELTSEEKIKQAIEQLVLLYNDYYPHLFVFMGEKLHDLAEEYREVFNARSRELKKLWVGLINEGKASGKVREDKDSEIIYYGIIGMCNWMYKWYENNGRVPATEIGRIFSEMICEGIITK
ncbi:MAG: TetR/AcrR family transcriptional regulator [Bacillota bacterium]